MGGQEWPRRRHVRREAPLSSGPWSLSPWFSDTFSPRMQTRAPTRSQRQPAHRALPDISDVADMTPPLNLRAGLIVRYPHSGHSNTCTSNAINEATGTGGLKALTVRRGDRKLIRNGCCIGPGGGISRIAGDRKYRHFDRKRSQFGQPKENPHCCGGAGAHGGRGCGAKCRATGGVQGSRACRWVSGSLGLQDPYARRKSWNMEAQRPNRVIHEVFKRSAVAWFWLVGRRLESRDPRTRRPLLRSVGLSLDVVHQ